MSSVTSLGAPAFMTTYLLFLVGCVAQKVYFDCGAKVDVVDVQGLILSPGFPYNYSSGTHCVWQFFVPIDYQLILEIFDFDVFESHDGASQYSNMANFYDEDMEDEMTPSPGSSVEDESSKVATHQREADVAKNAKSLQDGDEKQVIVQEQSTKMEIAKVSNSAKRSADVALNSAPQPSLVVIPDSLHPDNNKPYNSPSTTEKTTTISSTFVTETSSVTPETPQSVLDACPHDVLYISDLITFSSRFCGSNRPPSSQLVFGSHQEMVEVIMELITTTHWGRGFALLFHYHNLTEPGGVRRDVAFAASKVDSLLAAVSGAAFLAMILTSALCIIFRPRLCPKRANCSTSSGPEMVEGAPNVVSEVSELQLIAENQVNLEITRKQENKNEASPHTVSAGGDVSQSPEVDLSSGLTELDLGADEVFISTSPAPNAVPNRLPLSPHTQHERFLRLSDTGPGPSGDWPSPDSSAPRSKSGISSRPRAWSVRTFHDFLPPLPQLHKRWCSWNSNSPFTKLVDTGTASLVADGRGNNGREVFSEVNLAKADPNATSDSSISTASYPLTQSAQRQRRLNSTSNLRRSRFTGPCFGFGTTDTTKTPAIQGPSAEPVSGSSPTDRDVSHAGKRRGEVQGDVEHVSVPVFAISEEEDRQPLVPAEHLEQLAVLPVLNGLARGAHDGKRSTTAGGSPKSQRARGEWRPWGSQASGGVLPSLKTSRSGCDVQVPISPATALCSVVHQM